MKIVAQKQHSLKCFVLAAGVALKSTVGLSKYWVLLHTGARFWYFTTESVRDSSGHKAQSVHCCCSVQLETICNCVWTKNIAYDWSHGIERKAQNSTEVTTWENLNLMNLLNNLTDRQTDTDTHTHTHSQKVSLRSVCVVQRSFYYKSNGVKTKWRLISSYRGITKLGKIQSSRNTRKRSNYTIAISLFSPKGLVNHFKSSLRFSHVHFEVRLAEVIIGLWKRLFSSK